MLFLKEAGTLFLAMILPLTLAALPTSLLVADHESGWEQFVGVFPLSKGKIVLARYLFCLLLIILVSGLVLALSLVAHAIFGQYSLELHLIIVGVGLLFGILYVVVLLPFIYSFGTFGNTIVNIIFLALIMGGGYALQKTSFGVTFITWLTQVNKVLLIIGTVLLLLGGTLISLQASIMIYTRTFTA
ncbi:ABC-2 transporter permease [Ligilactobacillus apodemi]|nr:ABC-2 transporter permease [Ligilactobacillus apodemi]MCR1901233.1 ABC-2 transporter permease [Ligilactobacillus apodemi]